jgi:hypothetical protein
MSRLWHVLLEGQRKEHDPFDEYIELLLHFLWTSCFTIVWPLGSVFALINQLLELRFDTLKMLVARRRRFPTTRNMSLVWVPCCARIICHVSIVTNVVLLLLPYQQYQMWIEQTRELEPQPFLVNGTWQKVLAAFCALWLTFVGVRQIAVIVARLGFMAPPCKWLTADACHHEGEAEEEPLPSPTRSPSVVSFRSGAAQQVHVVLSPGQKCVDFDNRMVESI